jgi:hypothetical protein
MRQLRYIEIWPDLNGRSYVVRFMLKYKGLMHVIYTESLESQSKRLLDWIETGMI